MISPVEMEVESVVQESRTARTLRLRWPEGCLFEFQTGQVIGLAWPDTPKRWGTYSLSSCAMEQGYFDITVNRTGRMGTRLVDETRAGMKFRVMPPSGRFVPQFDAWKHFILLAGGGGVTPFRGFIREATWRELPVRLTLLYSAKEPEDLLFREELNALARRNPHFECRFFITRSGPGIPDGAVSGRLNAERILPHVVHLPETVFYICGPLAMVETLEQIVSNELHARREQIKTEKWRVEYPDAE